MENSERRVAGGHELKNLREKRRLKQRNLSAILDLDVATISKYETGKKIPSLNRLTRILFALDATPLEQKRTMNAFGYWRPAILPTDEDNRRIVKGTGGLLRQLGIPAYVLDCTTRPIAWNHFIPKMLGETGETPPLNVYDRQPGFMALKLFTSQPILKSYFDPRIQLSQRIDNWDEFIEPNLKSAYEFLWEHRETQWYQDLVSGLKVSDPIFAEKWRVLEETEFSLLFANGRPKHSIALDVPDIGVLAFRLALEPISIDDRFSVMYYFPADVKTMEMVDQWHQFGKLII